MIVWRVLADPLEGTDIFTDEWHGKAADAYLAARALEAAGHGGVEVNRCTLLPHLSPVDLLNRRGLSATVVPPETWRSTGNHSKRATRGGRS